MQRVKPFDLYYLPFPAEASEGVNGIVGYEVATDRYTVAIDASKPEEVQKHALKHELQHIRKKHLEDLRGTIEEVEEEADEPMTDEELQELLTYARKVVRA